MKRPAHIKVLRGISTAACAAGERHLLKPLETLFYIKSIWPDKPVPFAAGGKRETTAWGQITNEARENLIEISKRCGRTNKRRVSALIDLGFLRIEADGLHAIGWDQLAERYGILHKRFYHISITKHVQLEYIVKAKVLSEKKQHCLLGYKTHLKRQQYQAEVIEQVSGSLNCETVAKHQLSNFISEGQLYDQEARYALSLRYVNRKETHLNGDLEINYKTGSKLFGYDLYGPTSKAKTGAFAKLKRSLVKMGVITVEPRRTQILRGTNTTMKKRKVRLGFVKYERDLGEAYLIQPDKIDVLPVNAVDAQFEHMRALEAKFTALLNQRNEAKAA